MTQTPVSSVIPVKREVITATGVITVRPFRLFGEMEQLNTWLPKLGPFFAQLKAGDYWPALQQASEACMHLAMLSARVDRAQLEALEAEEQLAVLVAMVEVNLDFFVHRLTPQITGMLVSLTPAVPGGAPVFQDMTVRAAATTTTVTEAPETSGQPPQTH